MVQLNTRFFSYLSCFILSATATLKYCRVFISLFLKRCGHRLEMSLLYENTGEKALVEIEVKEANFWTFSDQSLCL